MENFIFEGYLEDTLLCDKLIAYFNSAEDKVPGKTGRGVNPNVKISTDCQLKGPLLQEYVIALQKVVDKYIEKFPWCNGYAPWNIIENLNLQHYAPGEGYYGWHTERGSADPIVSARHLVFLTYLNDVTDGGGTEFYYQKITTTARKGKTLLWPADWTYTHRGVVSPTQDKHIVTGWFSYLPSK